MSWILFTIIWFISGFTCTFIGIYAFYRNKKMKEQCISKTEATIIDIIKQKSRRNRNGHTRISYSYFPVIEFYVNEKIIREKHNIGYSYSKYKVGESVTVFYNPNKPAEYFIEGDKSKKIIGVTCTIVGITHLLVGCASSIMFFA